MNKKQIQSAIAHEVNIQVLDKEQQLTDEAVAFINNAVEHVIEQKSRSILKRLFTWLAHRCS